MLILLFVTSTRFVQAQEAPRRIGIGVEVGTETGVTLKFNPGKKFAYELLAAWNVGDFVFVNGHAVYTKALEENPRVRAAYGFGAYVGVYESRRRSDGFVGLSGRGAVVYAFDRYEAYFQLTPRFDLLPGTRFHVGGGLGFRVFI